MELATITYQDELVERCKKGDPLSYRELYNKYSRAMYNTSLRIVNNTAEAEDILQESFLDAFKKIQDFESRSTFGAWLKQIVVNKSINQLKKKKVLMLEIEKVNAEDIEDDQGIPEEEMSYKVMEVKNAISALPNGYRTVLSLYLLEGYDHEEISGILGVAESTVRTQYMRAKQKLISSLKKRNLS